MTKIKNKYYLYFLYILPFIICLAIYLIHPPLFESNDDVTILNALSGRITGEPSGEAMFFSVFLGFPISFLYRLFPQIQWYSFFLISLNIICFAIIINFSFKNIYSKNKHIIIPFLTSIITILSLWSIALIQYTYVSALCGAAAIILLFFGKRKTTSIIFLLLSIMIRIQSGLIALAFYCISFLFNSLLKFDSKLNLKTFIINTILPIVFVTILVLGVAYGDIYLKANFFEPKGYIEYQKAQSSYVDYPIVAFENATDIVSKYNWSEELYNLSRNFFMMDERINTDSMTYMASLSPLKTQGLSEIIINFNEVVLNDVTLLALLVLSLNIALVAFAIQLYNGINYKNIIYFIFNVFNSLTYILVLIYIFYKGRIIFRAIYPASLVFMASSLTVFVLSINNINRTKILKKDYFISSLLCVITLVLYILNKGLYFSAFIVLTLSYLMLMIKNIKPLYKYPLIAILTLLLIFGNLIRSKDISDPIYKGNSKFKYSTINTINKGNHIKDIIEEYASINKDNIYIYGMDLIFDGRINPQQKHVNNLMFWGGTIYNSQLYLDQLNSLNIDTLNLKTFLLNNVYYISDNKHYKFHDDLLKLMENVKKGKFDLVENYKGLIKIYKYRTDEP